MKTSKENLACWIAVNRKQMGLEEFYHRTGMDFDDFTKTYSRETRRAWRSYQTGKKENRVIKDTHSHCKKRENHLLRIIEVWKKRYLDLKKRINPNQP